MDFVLDPAVLAGLLTLIILEVVLGIDNLVFIAILADKLPPEQRDRARILGLSLALFMRLGLLASIAWIIGLTAPVFEVAGHSFSWRDLILIGGGIFLLLKATKEMHERLEGDGHQASSGVAQASFGIVIAQIIALDAVFSLDSIITAVGMVDELWVMMAAVVISMGIMIVASKPLTAFVSRHPTVIILCLSFLLLIGASLIAQGFGFDFPKGYLYAAMGFSIAIETFNQVALRNRRKAMDRVPMRQRAADGIIRLLTPGRALPGTPAAAEGADDEDEVAFQPSEQEMIRGVIELADRPVRAIMTSRSELFWLDLDTPRAELVDRLVSTARTRVLLAERELDNLQGVVETRAALQALLRDENADLRMLANRPLVVPDSITALRLTDIMRETGERFAVVVDQDGNVDGVVTSTDIFAAIAGDLAEDEDADEVERVDAHTFDVPAHIGLDELAGELDRPIAPLGRYTSLSGYLLFEFGRLPIAGERISRGGIEYEVLAASASRLERIRLRLEQPAGAGRG